MSLSFRSNLALPDLRRWGTQLSGPPVCLEVVVSRSCEDWISLSSAVTADVRYAPSVMVQGLGSVC